MRLKTFTASNMQEAMGIARDLMGEDAIIISSKNLGETKGVEVTVAIESPEDQTELDRVEDPPIYNDNYSSASFAAEAELYTPPLPEPSNAPGSDIQTEYNTLPITAKARALSDIEAIFRYHGTPQRLMNKLLKRADKQTANTTASIGELQAQITQLLDICFTFDDTILDIPNRYILVGPAGAGKTLTITKMATQLILNKKSCIVITTDTKQAGSVEQLSAFTEILGIPLNIANSRTELREMVKNAPQEAMVLIDSFGGNPYNFQDMKEIGEFASLQDIEPVLIIPAGMHEAEAEETARVYRFLDIEKILITRADAARRFGSVLAAAAAGDLTLTYVSSGNKASEDFRPLDAIALGQMLVQCKKDNAMNFNEGTS